MTWALRGLLPSLGLNWLVRKKLGPLTIRKPAGRLYEVNLLQSVAGAQSVVGSAVLCFNPRGPTTAKINKKRTLGYRVGMTPGVGTSRISGRGTSVILPAIFAAEIPSLWASSSLCCKAYRAWNEIEAGKLFCKGVYMVTMRTLARRSLKSCSSPSSEASASGGLQRKAGTLFKYGSRAPSTPRDSRHLQTDANMPGRMCCRCYKNGTGKHKAFAFSARFEIKSAICPDLRSEASCIFEVKCKQVQCEHKRHQQSSTATCSFLQEILVVKLALLFCNLCLISLIIQVFHEAMQKQNDLRGSCSSGSCLYHPAFHDMDLDHSGPSVCEAEGNRRGGAFLLLRNLAAKRNWP